MAHRTKPFLTLGIKKVRSPSHVYVLLDTPGSAAEVARALAFAGNARAGLVEAEWNGRDLQARLDSLVARARADERVVCVASSDGSGSDAVAALRRVIVRESVLPARHFAATPTDEDDLGAWMLTTIIAHTIERNPSLETLDAFLRSIEISLGRGDRKSTSQNLTAASNLIFYARKNAPAAEVDAVLAKHPALVALRRLDDHRLWPAEGTQFEQDFAHLGERHAHAAVQLAVQALAHHKITPAQAESIVRAVLSVPGVRAHFGTDRERDFIRAVQGHNIAIPEDVHGKRGWRS